MSRTSLILSSILGVTLLLGGAGCAADSDAPEGESEEAFSAIPSVPSPSDYPTESSWSLGRIQRACDLPASALEGAVGSIERRADGVYYSAKRDGRPIANASAFARTDSIFSRAHCLGQ